METGLINNEQIIVSFQDAAACIGCIDEPLHNSEKHTLPFAPWQNEYPYKPDVQFAITYSPASIYLQYEVTEEHVRAAHLGMNNPVYQDSCVEFFVSFDNSRSYYNLEFNCIGTVFGAYGSSGKHRELLPEAVLDQIKCQSHVQKGGGQAHIHWLLTVEIPFSTFFHHSLGSLKGQQCRANFYKCGDHLPKPHYLCWAKVQSQKPDFHLPQFFGTLLFR